MIPKIEDINVRSKRLEILDEKQFDQASLSIILRKIALVNKILGGNQITINAIEEYIKKNSSSTVRIVDLGCGGGDMCRAISKHFSDSKKDISIIGVDINSLSLKIAREESQSYANIQFQNIDVFTKEFVDLSPDIIVSTLTLHHFTDDSLIKALTNCLKIDDVFIVINDLHRSRLAYYLFIPVSYILGMGFYNRHDGLISILRGFRRKDLVEYTKRLNNVYPDITSMIKWKWAFRYLWTIKRI